MSYPPRAFREMREDVLLEAVDAIGLAALVVGRDGAPDNTGRFARRLSIALAMFQGPHAYVHPGWYPAKREHGKVVPTWNYVVIQAHGTLSTTRDPA